MGPKPTQAAKKVVKAAKKKPSAGGSGRSAAYSQWEIDLLLKLVAQLLPIGSEQWEALGDQFRACLPMGMAVRDTDSLKAKFKTLRLHKKPTGDPDCPVVMLKFAGPAS
jgi:hypothetical protein